MRNKNTCDIARLLWLLWHARALERGSYSDNDQHPRWFDAGVPRCVAPGMAAFMQFESLAMAVLVAGTFLAIATIVGTFVTTWMTGRIANMNAAAIFIALLFWGWLWGVWGMLLSIPIIVIVKVVSQHVEQLHPLAELLGD